MTVGNKEIKVNGEVIEIKVAPKIFENRVFVPLSFVSKALGHEATWDGEERVVSIFTDATDFFNFEVLEESYRKPVRIDGDMLFTDMSGEKEILASRYFENVEKAIEKEANYYKIQSADFKFVDSSSYDSLRVYEKKYGDKEDTIIIVTIGKNAISFEGKGFGKEEMLVLMESIAK